jgi:antitoxin component YwqK of YwqJK toxin-antitoxin module
MSTSKTKVYMIAMLCLLAMACQQSTSTRPEAAVDLKNFEEEPLKGTAVKRVVRRGPNDKIIEEGFVRNGLKDGAWITYDEEGKVVTVTTYIEGQLNGIHLELDKSYRLVSTTGYKNNDFHGSAKKYKFSRVTEELPYENGKLEGLYKKFYENNGQPQVEANYKNGLQHGIMKQFNSEGKQIMEIVYENGKQLSSKIIGAE